MEYDLTRDEKALLSWMVEANANDALDERFRILWLLGGAQIDGYSGSRETIPELEPDMLDALEEEGLLRCQRNTQTKTSTSGSKRPKVTQREIETSRRCTLLVRRAREAVENNFVKEDPQPQQPSVIHQTNYFHAAVSQSAIGPYSHIELTQNLNLDAVRTRIDEEGGEYREDLHDLLDLAESASRDGTTLERGALEKFNEAMQERSWIVSPVVSLLLGFLT